MGQFSVKFGTVYIASVGVVNNTTHCFWNQIYGDLVL